MKKIAMLLLCTAALIFVMVSVQPSQQKTPKEPSASSSNSMSFNSNSNTEFSQESSAVPADTKQSDSYTVKEYQGHLAVFKNNDTVPFLEYETDIQLLPEKDRDILKEGKTVHTMAEVEKIVEDYDS